jgi:aminocarboxymuconate-semialdehyde decarboxylase
MRVVDLHCHFIPPALIDRLAKEGAAHSITVNDERTVSFAGRASTQKVPAGMLDLGRRLRWMDEQGIEVQVLSAWMDFSAYELDPEDGAWLARALNELTVEALAAHPDRFRAMAAVPLQAPELAADELRFALEALGMVAVEIGTAIAGAELDDPVLEAFWDAAEALDALVLVHPPNRSLGYDRLQRYFFDNIVSNPAEETIAAAHLIFGGVLERHPALRVFLTHGGGFLPYQIGRQDRGFAARPGVTATHLNTPPSTFLRRFFYDTVVHSPDAIRFLASRVGADRVLLGSDYPFAMGDPEPLATVRTAGLSDDAVAAILGGNVADALGSRSGDGFAR